MESPISIETVGKEPCWGCNHQAHLAGLYQKDPRIFVQHQYFLPIRRFFSQGVAVLNASSGYFHQSTRSRYN